MIGQYSLFKLLEEYGINPRNIEGYKKDKILTDGEYESILYVLEFLRNELNIKARRIEMCPSILYFGVQNIKKNYEYLSSQGFNISKINNCLHILNCNPIMLEETYLYVLRNYGEEYINMLPSVLSVPVTLLEDIEEISNVDYQKGEFYQLQFLELHLARII